MAKAPKTSSKLLRESRSRAPNPKGWTGVFEVRDAWVPSLATRLADIQGKKKRGQGS